MTFSETVGTKVGTVTLAGPRYFDKYVLLPVKCDCGTAWGVRPSDWKNGKISKCKVSANHGYKVVPGDKSGRLTAISEVPMMVSGRTKRGVKSTCECGNEMLCTIDKFYTGHTRSCGECTQGRMGLTQDHLMTNVEFKEIDDVPIRRPLHGWTQGTANSVGELV